MVSKEQLGRYSLLATLAVFWFAIGLGATIAGPTLPDQAIRLGVEIQVVAYVYSVSGVFTILGALVNGVLADLFPKYTLPLFICLAALSACAICSRSYATSIPPFLVCCILGNFAIMGADCLGNSLVFRVWGDAASPPLHLLHGFFGVGSVAGPFVAVPFLSPETVPNTTCISNSSFTDCSSMEIPFWISGSLMFVSAGSMVVIYLAGAVTMAAATPTSVLQVCSPKACTSDGPVASTVVLLVIFCLVYFFLLGGQFVVAAYFFTYLTTRQDNPLGKQQSSVIMGGYNAAFLLGRLSASGISKVISIKVMVLTEVVICAVSGVGLFWLGSQHLAALWVFVLLIGGFSAPVWPGSMTFLGQYLVITTMTFFILTFGMGCGNFFFNWLVGFIFQEYSVEDILIVVMLCYIMLAAMSFAIFGVGSRVNALKQNKELQEKHSVNGVSNYAFEEQREAEITKL